MKATKWKSSKLVGKSRTVSIESTRMNSSSPQWNHCANHNRFLSAFHLKQKATYQVMWDICDCPSELCRHKGKRQNDQVEDGQEKKVEEIKSSRLHPVRIWIVVSVSTSNHFSELSVKSQILRSLFTIFCVQGWENTRRGSASENWIEES